MDSRIFSDIVVPQYDHSTTLRITVTKYGEPLVISPMGAMFTMRKPDGHTIINNCIVSNSVVTITTTTQMTVLPGKIPFQLVLFSGTNVISTINGDLTVIQAVDQQDVTSTDEFTILQQIAYYGSLAKSYAVGDTGIRTGEDTDNAKYYYQLSRNTTTGLVPKGTVTFAQLQALSSPTVNDLYNVSDAFTSTSAFKDGSGISYPAGSDVYYTQDGKWDVLGGQTGTGVKGSAEGNYRKGDVNVTKANIGLPNGVNVVRSTMQPSSTANIWVRPY
jgi:hypothetical protein